MAWLLIHFPMRAYRKEGHLFLPDSASCRLYRSLYQGHLLHNRRSYHHAAHDGCCCEHFSVVKLSHFGSLLGIRIFLMPVFGRYHYLFVFRRSGFVVPFLSNEWNTKITTVILWLCDCFCVRVWIRKCIPAYVRSADNCSIKAVWYTSGKCNHMTVFGKCYIALHYISGF